MDWSYYQRRGELKPALSLCLEAAHLRLPLLTTSGGDFGITLNLPETTIVHRQSGYRSRLRPGEHAMPVFFTDPVGTRYEEGFVLGRTPSTPPTVGFCGKAPGDPATSIKEHLAVAARNLSRALGLNPFDKQVVMSSSRLRHRALGVFRRDPRFQTNFTVRRRYRAGAVTDADRERTTQEYYDNHLSSDLVICVRGTGNFSARLYETLAMGRVPILIDTDSPLPDIGPACWSDHLVQVDSQRLDQVPTVTLAWLEGRDLSAQFKRNRDLWRSRLSLAGFWSNELARLRTRPRREE